MVKYRKYGMKRIQCGILSGFIILLFVNFTQAANWINITSGTAVVQPLPAVIPEPQLTVQAYDASNNPVGREEWSRIKSYQVTLEVPGVAVSDQLRNSITYSELKIPTLENQTYQTGKPAYPLKMIMLKIPSFASPQISITGETEVPASNFLPMPAQPPIYDTAGSAPPGFTRDETVYGSSQLYPASRIISSGFGAVVDHNMLTLEVALVRSNCAGRVIYIAKTVQVTITFNFPSPLPSQKVNNKYYVLLNKQFVGNQLLNQFIDWKKHKGYEVFTISTLDIKPGTGDPNFDEINAYMQNIYDTRGLPKYLLIVGDQTTANGVCPYFIAGGSDYNFFTDYRFAMDIHSTLQVPQLIYGRLPASDNAELNYMLQKVISMDKTPPVPNGQSNMYNKVLIASDISDGSDPNDGVIDGYSDKTYLETADAVACYFEQDALGVDYTCTRAFMKIDNISNSTKWQFYGSILWAGATGSQAEIGNRVYSTLVPDASAVSSIVNTVNNGCSILYHRDHGQFDGFYWPTFRTSNVVDLRNGNNLPLIISINCSTGIWAGGPSCFGRAWLNHANNGGAYCVIAATKATSTPLNEYFSHGLMGAFLCNSTNPSENWFTWHNNHPQLWTSNLPTPSQDISYLGFTPGSATKTGDMLHFGKMYTYQIYSSAAIYETIAKYHCIGDPEAEIVLHEPADISSGVTVTPSSISKGYPNVVTVSTGRKGLRVCLLNEALGVFGVQTTGANGNATFLVLANATGSVDLTITGFGVRPYMAAVPVIDGGIPTDITIQNIRLDGVYTFQASRNIFVGPGVEVSSTSNIGLIAGQQVSFSPDVSVSNGAAFTSRIGN